MDNGQVAKQNQNTVNASRFAGVFDFVVAMIFLIGAIIRNLNAFQFLVLTLFSFFFYAMGRYECKRAAFQDRVLRAMEIDK